MMGAIGRQKKEGKKGLKTQKSIINQKKNLLKPPPSCKPAEPSAAVAHHHHPGNLVAANVQCQML